MVGGEQFEPAEENPMIGFRGVYRYIREPDLFRLELDAFQKVRGEMGSTNLALMLPFVRTLSELRAIRDIVTTCRRLGVTCSICGQAPSVYPELMEHLVAWGIDSISVSPDVVSRARRMIAATEQKLILDAARPVLITRSIPKS